MDGHRLTGDHHPRARPPDVAEGELSRGQVRYEGPDTMVVESPATIIVRLARGTTFVPTPPVPGRTVVTAETKMGDSARVCLHGDPAAFTIVPTNCSTQSVTSNAANKWSWNVTPHQSGIRSLQVQVMALLARMPGKVEFDSTYSVVVLVAPRPLLTRVGDFLKSWQGILASLAAIVASIAAILKLFRKPKRPSDENQSAPVSGPSNTDSG